MLVINWKTSLDLERAWILGQPVTTKGKFRTRQKGRVLRYWGLLQRLPPINASLPISDETIDIHVYLVSYIVSAEERRRCGTIILQCPCYAARAGRKAAGPDPL